jgi:SAM-dependent methyltransferase
LVPDVAALYDWECRHVLGRLDQDVGFWLDRAREAGDPVLELACGTGRLTGALAQRGVDVVGLDNDRAMLAAAVASSKSGGSRPVFVAADMRRFALARRFRLVFVAYNSLQLLADLAEMTACLRLAREHLAARGFVGVEVTDFQQGGADGDGEPPVVLGEAEGVRLTGSLKHDFATRSSQYRRRFSGDGWAVENEVVVRSLDRAELETVLEHAGLTKVRWSTAGRTVRAIASPEGSSGGVDAGRGLT